MKLLFLTMTKLDSLQGRGIYIDLLNLFKEEGHEIFIVSPSERRLKEKTVLRKENGVSILNVKTLNLQKSTLLEKGVGQLLLEYQYLNGIKKYFANEKFDLVIYSTPPITFSKVIRYIKNRDGAYSYLLLKDIFPQNAVDMQMIKNRGFLHRFLKKKEKEFYLLSDTIGCMSDANKKYIIKHNPNINSKKIEVNPNSIQPFEITQSTEDKNIIKEKYGLPLDKKVFVYGGNLGKPQGVEFLLETIGSNINPNIFFLVIGSGTEFNRIEKWFQTQKPKNALLLAKLPKNDYDLLLNACDVGMIFLHKDFTIPNFPSRLLSYLEMNMPIIAATDSNTDLGSVIEKAHCGFSIKSGDIKSMNNGIQNLISNPEEFQRMRENAHKLLIDEYMVSNSYDLIMNKLKNV